MSEGGLSTKGTKDTKVDFGLNCDFWDYVFDRIWWSVHAGHGGYEGGLGVWGQLAEHDVGVGGWELAGVVAADVCRG